MYFGVSAQVRHIRASIRRGDEMPKFLVYWDERVMKDTTTVNAILADLKSVGGELVHADFQVSVIEAGAGAVVNAILARHILLKSGRSFLMAEVANIAFSGPGQFGHALEKLTT